MMRVLVGVLVAVAASFGGTIETGNLYSNANGSNGLSFYTIAVTGTNNAGNPYSIHIRGAATGAMFIGQERCGIPAGAPVPRNCTWSFTGTDSIDTRQKAYLTVGEIFWDGTLYDLNSQTSLSALFDFSITAASATVQSTLVGSFVAPLHEVSFPLAPASVAMTFSLGQQFNNTTGPLYFLTETLTGNFTYSGTAWQAPVGADWNATIEYTAVPEPATTVLSAAGLLGLVAARRRRALRAEGNA